MQVKVYAKLNLTLNVLGKQNGFHNIDSAVTSVNIFDVVQVLPRADARVTVSGLDLVSTTQNTAYKAACAFLERFKKGKIVNGVNSQPILGVDIAINKGIPIGAGMGGSSADAAAVIYALSSLYNVDVNSSAIRGLCAELGSDINFMLHGGIARLRGKGDDVEYGKSGVPLYFALTTFNTSMSTAAVYTQFDKLDAKQAFADNDALLTALQSGRTCDIVECLNNHLQAAAVSLSSYAYDYLQFCVNNGLRFNMTGSGSAYYVACFDEQSAMDIAELLNSNGFKTVVCHSVSNGIEIV